jgi:hypothetical protein
VKASRGTVLLPDTTLDQVLDQDFDMVVLPGGLPGATHLDQDPRMHDLLKRQAGQARWSAAICAAPKVLANAGLLDGRHGDQLSGRRGRGRLSVDAAGRSARRGRRQGRHVPRARYRDGLRAAADRLAGRSREPAPMSKPRWCARLDGAAAACRC